MMPVTISERFVEQRLDEKSASAFATPTVKVPKSTYCKESVERLELVLHNYPNRVMRHDQLLRELFPSAPMFLSAVFFDRTVLSGRVQMEKAISQAAQAVSDTKAEIYALSDEVAVAVIFA